MNKECSLCMMEYTATSKHQHFCDKVCLEYFLRNAGSYEHTEGNDTILMV